MAGMGRGAYDTGPATDYFAITPNDGADLAYETREIIVATGGTLAVQKRNGDAVILTLPAGRFALVIKRVLATGTTATGLTGVV